MNGLFFGENVTGLPCTETLNEAGLPLATMRLWGWDTMGDTTVKVTMLLVKLP